MTLLAGGRVVLPSRVLDPGWVEVAGDRVTAVGAGAALDEIDVDLTGRIVVPGFVDVHVHGGGGSSFTPGDVEEAADVVAFHRRHGTTTAIASLVAAPVPQLERAVLALSDLVVDGLLAGVHLEGPWLSAAYCGAHDPTLLVSPDPAEIARLVSCGRGAVRMVTLAPELPGGLRAVRQLADAGVLAAIGHTDATYEVTRAALAAGATVGTHLFNAMRPVHQREPGPVLALLEQPQTTVELIADGIHVHPAVLRHVIGAVGVERVALVTDAMAAAGVGDGDYRLGDLAVHVSDGVARLRHGGATAGSTLTMAAAFRYIAEECGVPLPAVTRMTAETPAKTLRLVDRGTIAPGYRADLVVLDGRLRVTAVMAAGRWVPDTGRDPLPAPGRTIRQSHR